MAMGVPLRHWAVTVVASFGSMALGSACVHGYMQPEMHIETSDFDKEADSRRKAIEEVSRLAMDERFAAPSAGSSTAASSGRSAPAG